MKRVKDSLRNWSLLNKSFNFIIKRSFCILLFLFNFQVSGQTVNHVSNGSFENHYTCIWPNDINKAKTWRTIDSTYKPSLFYSNCPGFNNVPYNGQGFQNPRSGNNYALIIAYCVNGGCSNSFNRSYIRNRLKTPLQAGKSYCVKFYCNVPNTSTYGSDGLGAFFGNNISLDTILKSEIALNYFTPQIQNVIGNILTDTLNWISISGTFVASGNETNIVIGNFKDNASTNASAISTSTIIETDMYIDDVSCIPLDLPAYAHSSNDIWAIPGTTTYIGRQQDVGIDEACEWFKLPNTTSVIANVAGLTLTVAATTETYMVKQDICGVIKYDTVVVHASAAGSNELSINNYELKVYPQPADDIINIELANELNDITCNAKIFNALGQMIREEDIIFKDNQSTINTKELCNGIYYLRIDVMKQTVSKRFIIGK